MTTHAKTLVTIATYNEIENLPRLIDEIFVSSPVVDVLVIDDNSPDGTGRWCDEKAAQDPRIHCLHRVGKLGLGSATVAGMQFAIGNGYEFVLNMDADFSHHPRYLPALLAGIHQPVQPPIDCMIGSRYIPGGRIEGWPWRRHFMSRGVNLYARLLLGLRVRDCSGAFRCYRTSRLAQLDFASLLSRGYSFQEEILWQLKRIGCRFAETPIVFVDRVSGQSKINLREALAAIGVVMRLAWRNVFRQPLAKAQQPAR